MAMAHDEKGFFSAGWDGEAKQWDLNTGQMVRSFTCHGAQLSAIALRPLEAPIGSNPPSNKPSPPDASSSTMRTNSRPHSPDQSKSNDMKVDNSDAKSDTSMNSLFDDDQAGMDQEPEGLNLPTGPGTSSLFSRPGTPASKPSFALPTNGIQRKPIDRNIPPTLDPISYGAFSPDILLTAFIDGQVVLWDKRIQSYDFSDSRRAGVGRLEMSEKTPPWCMSACWSSDGNQVYAGRRNGTVEVWDMRQTGRSGPTGNPRLLKTLNNPGNSGVVSSVVAFPDGKHIATASIDNIRLWNAAEANEPDRYGRAKSGVQFKIIPGHHGGYVSQMSKSINTLCSHVPVIDPAGRFLVSASSNRGWPYGESTRSVFVHDIKHVY